MSKVLEMLRRGKKQVALVAVIAAAIVIPASLYALTPDRTENSKTNPIDYVDFNTYKDGAIGHEHNFVGIREATAPNVWDDTVKVERGKEYVVRMYVHNNAASSLGLVANDVTGRITLPTTTGRSVQIDGSISASNFGANKKGNAGQPGMVYDQATFTGDENFNVAYIPGTLKYETNKMNTALPESIFTSAGALLGYDKLDGKIPGCFEYAGYVSFKVKPQFAEAPKDFSIQKQVRKEGATDGFKENVEVQPGDTVDYRIEVKNTGGTQINNVALKDQLPTGMSFVPGTVKILNANNPSGAYVQDGDKLVTSGINIGHYTPGSNAMVVFKAKAAAADKLECGVNTLTNKASAQPEGQNPKEDTADVTVPKDCPPAPEYKCTALAVSKLSDTKFKFETGYTVKGGEFKSASYTIRNEAGQVVDTVSGTPNAVEYTQTNPGKYSVQATVTFTVDGKDVTATGEACKKAFEVPTPPTPEKIKVCDLESKKIITINKEDFDESKHSTNLKDCEEQPPVEENCEIPGKEHLPKDDPACKETPVTPEEKCPIPGMEHLPANSAECEKPVGPSELPQTGSANGVLTIAGLSTLTLVLGYAVTARRTIG